MNRADIATVALNDQMEQRVRIAASLLLASRVDTSVRPINAKVRLWDGTRCDLLIADLSDAYGRQASAMAEKRGTAVLAIGDKPAEISLQCGAVPASSPAPVLAKHMRDLLTHGKLCDPTDPNDDSILPALCVLAEVRYRGRAVDAVCNGLTLNIRPEAGRIYASNLGALLSASDYFSSAAWELQIAAASDTTHLADGPSRSLEAFLLHAAFQGRAQLPPFPEGRYQLHDWPDVGTAPEFIGALKVAGSLVRAPATARELQQSSMLGEEEVNASLWAYQASNLLLADNGANREARSPPPTAHFSGILSRIASRFGLTRH